MKIRSSFLCAAAALAFAGTAAQAQESDVLVMRRAVAPAKDPSALKPVEGADTNSYYWVTSGWLRGDPACSSESEQKRLRGCVYQGQPANEANCPQPAPAQTRLVEDYRACEFSWTTTVTGTWAETCADTTRPVSAECRRQDGTPVDDVYCSSITKPIVEKGFNEAGCTYEWGIGDWGNWKSQCSAETTRERKVECMRSNGSVAPDALCKEEKPATFEPGENYSNCDFRWVPSEWEAEQQSCGGTVHQTRTVTCKRTDGQEADPSLCLDPVPELEQDAPDYGACSFTWKTGEWRDWNSQCSTQSKRTRDVYCEREDGKRVDPGNCGAGRPNDEETSEILSGCGYEWKTDDWSTTPQCSSAAESTRKVTCHRTDNLLVDDSLCDAGKRPSDTRTVGDYSNCSYNWSSGPISWDSTCSDEAHGTRTVKCMRSDNTEVPEQECVIANKPSATLAEPNYDGCSSDWASSEWSEWDSQCSSTARRSRQVQCVQQRPSGPLSVARSNCNIDEIPSEGESLAIWSGCTAEWSQGNWGWNGVDGAQSSSCSASPKQTRTVTCRKRTAPDGVYQTLADSECPTPKPDTQKTLAASYESCTYVWNPGPWSDWDSTCSETAHRTRTTQCLRKDGSDTPVSPGNCDPTQEGAKTSETATVVTDCGGVLKNGDFEDGFSEWDTNVYNEITTDSYSGSQAAYLKNGSSRLYQMLGEPVTAGQTLNVSFFCKRMGTYAGMKFSFRNRGGATFRVDTQMNCKPGEWTENRFSIPVNVNTNLEVWTFGPSSGSGYAVIIDNIIVKVN